MTGAEAVVTGAAVATVGALIGSVVALWQAVVLGRAVDREIDAMKRENGEP